jgi:hypothetical protein
MKMKKVRLNPAVRSMYANETPAPKKGAAQGQSVDAYLTQLNHPLKDGLIALRNAILLSNNGISEHIKWNAPSFIYRGDDRATFRLPPKGGIQLILHRGVKVKDTTGFQFADPSGLVVWAAPDRGVLTFADNKALQRHIDAVVDLVMRWMRATTGGSAPPKSQGAASTPRTYVKDAKQPKRTPAKRKKRP